MFYISRFIAPNFQDSLCRLWEGDDQPVFSMGKPYLFSDRSVAERVLWRLQARYPSTFATEHFPAKPITYEICEAKKPSGRYLVFSTGGYEPATSIPAGRYDDLQDAIKHADSVTYKMAVVDSLQESRGFIYCNWDKPKITSITREDDYGHCTLLFVEVLI